MLVEEITIEKSTPVKKSMQADKIVLLARGLHKAFGGHVVLNDISMDLGQGDVVLLRGENGSGKTTLLNILTGNLEPDRGEIHIQINGNNEKFAWPREWWREISPFDHFTPERLAWKGIGRLWQDIRLFPTMTALENVAVATQNQMGENPALALLVPKVKNEEKKNIEKSSEWLRGLGLGERLDSSCDKISLGQMKRVAIARAIQAGAKVLFLDEPLSGLDSNGISEVMEYLENLVKENSITLVIVEHVFNIPTVLKLADTVWTLANGKLTVNNTYELNEGERNERHDLLNLLRSIAGENGKICSEELPGGARLTNVDPVQHSNSPVTLEVKDLVVKRGIRTVINGLSFKLKKGQIAVLEAPNGWGKSSLLDVISGVYPVEAGSITLNRKEITSLPTHKRIKMGLSYLRSQQTVFNSLSVEEHKRLSNTKNKLFKGSLAENSKGSFLSGGEKQKLLIEMLPAADVYLLDEPMIGLDKEAIVRFKERLMQIIKSGKTILITMPEKDISIRCF